MNIVERPRLQEMIVTADEYSSLKKSPEVIVVMATPEGQGEKFCVT